MISKGVFAAKRSLTRTIDILNKATKENIPADVADSLWLAFRSDSYKTLQDVRNRLTYVRESIHLANYRCDSSPAKCEDRGVPAYAGVGQGDITICTKGRAQSNDSVNSHLNNVGHLSYLIIHETAHRFLGLDDVGYHGGGCSESRDSVHRTGREVPGTDGLGTSDRLFNADSFRCFVHFVLKMQNERRRTRANIYRGKKLKINQTPGGELYWDSLHLSSRYPTFEIETGLPDSGVSGSKFRWYFRDAQGIEYSLSNLKGDNTGTFRFENKSVRFPERLKRIISSNGIQSGEVVCGIVVPGREDPVVLRNDVRFLPGKDAFDPYSFPDIF